MGGGRGVFLLVLNLLVSSVITLVAKGLPVAQRDTAPRQALVPMGRRLPTN